MSAPDPGSPALRALVREALYAALRDRLPAPDGTDGTVGVGEPVTIHGDDDLAAFVRRVLDLADDPVRGPDLRAGRIRFRLAGARAPAAAAEPPGQPAREHRHERGAVTERHVRAAARAGVALVLGPGAVLTPMGRDRARADRVEIVRDPPTDRRNG